MSTEVEIRGDAWWSRLFGHRWFVIALASASLVAVTASMLYDFITPGRDLEPGLAGWVASAIFFGALLSIRVPRNAVGPTLLMAGAFGALGSVAGVLEPADPTAPTVPEAVGIGLGIIAYFSFFWLSMGLLPLLFPTGRPLSRRWAVFGWVGAGALALAVVPALFPEEQCTVQALESGCDVWASNPIGVPGLEALEYGPIGGVLFAVLMLSMLGSIISLILRFVRSRGVERQQIKWVVLVIVFNALLVFGYEFVWESALDLPPVPDAVWSLVMFVSWTAIPVAIAVGIFKYRLYEIDRIVNRTIVYAIVVGLLGALFVAGSAWLPTLLPGDTSSLAVAASTLAVAALFNPLRRRAQHFVDHRFYRSRYDAQQVADDFTARLRDQVDPEAVTSEWVEVVQRTMQPAAVSVWVREGSS